MKASNYTLAEILNFLGATPPGKSLPVIGGSPLRSDVKYASGTLASLANTGGEIILPSTKPETGVTNFDGIRPPTGKAWIVTGVRFLFDTTAGSTAAGVKAAVFASVAPANFKNGEFTISQAGEGDLLKLTGTDATNFKASTSNDDDFRSVIPFVLRPNSDASYKLLLAAGGAVDQLYKMELRVIEIVDNDKV